MHMLGRFFYVPVISLAPAICSTLLRVPYLAAEGPRDPLYTAEILKMAAVSHVLPGIHLIEPSSSEEHDSRLPDDCTT